MPNFKLPLSGDVTQTINPWTWFIKSVGGQFGLININLGKSSDPELEDQILQDVGSYGRQIGQMSDALSVLLKHIDPSVLTPQDKDAIDAFQHQVYEVDRIKAKRGAQE